jgi:hypothetical protein
MVKDSDVYCKLKKIIDLVDSWNTVHKDKGEADWHLQCRTGRRVCEYQFIGRILIQLDEYRRVSPKQLDWYFFKLMDIVEFPNFELWNSSQKLDARNMDLLQTCNATEVIDGIIILAAGGKPQDYDKDAERKASITVEPETSSERRKLWSNCCVQMLRIL